jgi:hypothetical protein
MISSFFGSLGSGEAQSKRPTAPGSLPAGLTGVNLFKDLNAAAIYFMLEGRLHIDLKYDTGAMKFSK